MRKMKLDVVNDYLDKLVDQNECVEKIDAKIVRGLVYIRYYFYMEYPSDTRQDVIDLTLEFFSLDEIQMEIRTYYSEKYNNGNMDRQSPAIVIEIYEEDSIQPLCSYENNLEYRKTENNGMQAQYGEWLGP